LQFVLFLLDFVDEAFESLYVLVYFDFFEGFAYSVYDLADVCGEADPVLFDIVFRGVGVYGFLLGHFGEGFEFEDELEPDVLHVEAVLVSDSSESFLYEFECWAVSGTPPRFQCTMNIRIQT
jgi:hypothetical protein